MKIEKNYVKIRRLNIGVWFDLRKIKIRNGLLLKVYYLKIKKYY